MKEASKKTAGRTVGAVIETLNFLVISFALASLSLFLRQSPVSILFFASFCWLLQTYYSCLRKTFKNKWTAVGITAAALILNAVILYFAGYPQGTMVPWKI